MNYERLAHLLSEMQSVRLAIVGDFFLDYYMVIDPQLEEVSLETGLPAHQVVELRPSPGAAGSVTTKVAALGVQAIYAVTMLGEDGNGYDLTSQLKKTGLRFEHVVRRGDRFTPTYGKPMLRRPDGREEEINRMDVKNRRPLPKEAEDAIVASLRQLVSGLDGIVVIDQVEQPNCGVVTDRVREEVCRLGCEYPGLVILADSRTRIGRFRNVMTKPNFTEASQALGLPVRGESEGAAREMAQRLASVMGRPVFLTIGPRGLVAADGREAHVVPAFPVEGALDTTGAGDTVTAGIVTALCAGASIAEAAEVGNLAASITIKQLGITGTATPRQMLQALEAHRRRDQAMRDR